MSNKDTEVKEKKYQIKISEKAVFKFTYYEKAINVASALAMSGYYIRLRKEDSTYVLLVFTDRN